MKKKNTSQKESIPISLLNKIQCTCQIYYIFNSILCLPSWHSRLDKTYPVLQTHFPSSHTPEWLLPWHCSSCLQYPPTDTLTEMINEWWRKCQSFFLYRLKITNYSSSILYKNLQLYIKFRIIDFLFIFIKDMLENRRNLCCQSLFGEC